MRTILSLSIICLSLILCSCEKESKHSGYIDKNEALVEKLTEVEGNSRTYNFDFELLKGYEKDFFYAPTDIPKALSSIPEEMRTTIHLPNVADLPFTPGTEKANIVTHWNNKNTLIFQIQISYLENSAKYNTDNQDFFIISATQLADNPFIDDPNSEDDPIDKWRSDFNIGGTESPDEIIIYKDLKLTADLPLFFKNLFPHWSTMYAYYSYNESEKQIIHRSVGAKMYYAWHNGVIFQIGYKFFDNPTLDMEPIVRQIILGL